MKVLFHPFFFPVFMTDLFSDLLDGVCSPECVQHFLDDWETTDSGTQPLDRLLSNAQRVLSANPEMAGALISTLLGSCFNGRPAGDAPATPL